METKCLMWINTNELGDLEGRPHPLVQTTVGGNAILRGGRAEYSRAVILSSARYGGPTRT